MTCIRKLNIRIFAFFILFLSKIILCEGEEKEEKEETIKIQIQSYIRSFNFIKVVIGITKVIL